MAQHGSSTLGASPKLGASRVGSSIRLEIEGLRFFAVFLVVIYHVWLGRVSGGVDIFLLISAFLMTGQFTRKIDRGDSLNLGRHWLHLAKRLLPIAVVVIAVSVLLSWAIIPGNRWQSIIDEAWSSLFYFENWTLANNAVNYYANHASASPFQHFWSLSIQGQIFILWPLLFLVVGKAYRWFNFNYKAVLFVVFGLIFAGSLAFSIIETSANQSYAYFDLRTRLWEFALGSLLALALPYLKFPWTLRILMGWLGLILIIACGLVLQVDQQFPGYLALWPTLSAAMVVIAGDTRGPSAEKISDVDAPAWRRWFVLPGSGWGVDRLLAAKPLVFMGRNSYGLYLWHWPLLVLLLIAADRGSPGFWVGLALIALSVTLAIVTTRYIERPARKIPWIEAAWYRAIPVIVVALIVASGPILLWQGYIRNQISQTAANSTEDNPGAAALTPGFAVPQDYSASIKPAPADLPNQFAELGDPCADQFQTEDRDIEKNCTVYTPSGAITKTISVLGSSHSEQWLPALKFAADENGWQLISLWKGGCPYSYSTPGLDSDCNIYNGKATEYVESIKPNAIFFVGTDNKPSNNTETLQAGFEKTVTDLTSQGIQVLAIRDNPRFSFNMAECVINKGESAPACNPDREDLLADPSPFDTVSNPASGLFMLDLTDYICMPTVCPGIVGNMFVYIDDNHMTKDYSATLAPVLNQRIIEATGWQQN